MRTISKEEAREIAIGKIRSIGGYGIAAQMLGVGRKAMERVGSKRITSMYLIIRVLNEIPPVNGEYRKETVVVVEEGFGNREPQSFIVDNQLVIF